ncbi:MAG: hypothetical protein ACT4OS_05970 [Acidimicrobiales bacterium]
MAAHRRRRARPWAGDDPRPGGASRWWEARQETHDDVEGVTIRRIQPAQARKVYRCPGCAQEIAVGMGHLVVVPDHDVDSRRHWHQSCWENRHRRHPPRR